MPRHSRAFRTSSTSTFRPIRARETEAGPASSELSDQGGSCLLHRHIDPAELVLRTQACMSSWRGAHWRSVLTRCIVLTMTNRRDKAGSAYDPVKAIARWE